MTAVDAAKPQEFWLGFQPSLPDFQKMLLALPRLQAVGMRAVLNQQREMLAFLKRRYDQDLQLADRIASADEVKDIYDAVLSFYEGASKEYSAEAGKIAELGSRVASETIKGIKQEAEVLTELSPAKRAA